MTMFYNDHDIADAVRRFDHLPNAGQAARTLDRLREWTNDHSDGWAYWPKPRNAARRLVELLAGLDRFDPVDFSAEDLALALRPVKAFLTRQHVDHQEVLADPCWRCGGAGMLWGEEHGPHGTRCCPVCSPAPPAGRCPPEPTGVENSDCPDFSSHTENAIERLYPAGLPDSPDWEAIDAEAEAEYKVCEGH